MIGAILAGGYGKRLRPYTDRVPKGLLELKPGYTILHKQLDDFAAAGVKRVILLTSYLSKKIEDTLGSSYKGIGLEYLREEKPLGKLFSMRNLVEVCDEDVILRNGDTVCDIDLRKMEESAKDHDALISIFVTKMKSPFGVVDLASDVITGFREKPLLEVYINAGIYYFKKELFPYFLKDYNSTELETTIFPMLAGEGKIRAYKEEGDWIGVDSEKELESARKMFESRDDFDWGYRKLSGLHDGKPLWKYRVNSAKSFVPGIAGKFMVLKGKVWADNELFISGESSEISEKAVIRAEDIAILELVPSSS